MVAGRPSVCSVPWGELAIDDAPQFVGWDRMAERKLEIQFCWNDELKLGLIWLGGQSFEYPGYSNEAAARRAASRRLRILRSNVGSIIPAASS
jgi:hypothetical protein